MLNFLSQSGVHFKTIAGSGGATLGAINLELLTEWISTNSLKILEEIGLRLVLIEVEHYRTAFQAISSRVAALLLELAGTTSTIEGYGHEEITERLGAFRETVTNAIGAMKEDKVIEAGRKRITILDKGALQELGRL